MEEKDIPRVAELHTAFIPGALFPKLGRKFMHALYGAMLELDEARNYVWETDGRVNGFITVTAHAGRLMKKVFLKRPCPIFLGVLSYLIINPLRIGEVFETISYNRLAVVPEVTGELLFIALDGPARKKNISDALVNECTLWLRERGHDRVKVTTYTSNRGANTLLERMGFNLHGTLPFRQKSINLYVRATEPLGAGGESQETGS